MAIDLAEPNTYQTACGKGYWECAANEPSHVEYLQVTQYVSVAQRMQCHFNN